jgi:hypothetical protein
MVGNDLESKDFKNGVRRPFKHKDGATYRSSTLLLKKIQPFDKNQAFCLTQINAI